MSLLSSLFRRAPLPLPKLAGAVAAPSSWAALAGAVAARPPRTQRERAERLLLDANILVRPALYMLPLRSPPVGAWVPTTFRFPRPEGPLVLCGLGLAGGFSGALHGSLRLTVGTRRYLDEVDLRAVVNVAENHNDEIDWPRPVIVGAEEVLTVESQFTVDDGGPGEAGYLYAAAFHTDARGADFLQQQGELWAHTFDVTSTDEEPTAEVTWTAPAGGTIYLDDLVRGDDTNANTINVDMLDVLVGNVSLTPSPRLTYVSLDSVASSDDRASIAGVELRPGEQVTVRQTITGAGNYSKTNRFTFLGRRLRDALAV